MYIFILFVSGLVLFEGVFSLRLSSIIPFEINDLIYLALSNIEIRTRNVSNSKNFF